jgi:predicted ester cyclase
MKTRIMFLCAFAVALLMVGCQTDPKESMEYKELKAQLDNIAGQDSVEAANIEIYKKIGDINDTTEIDQLDQYFAADFKFHDMPEGMPQGLETFKGLLKGYITSIPNMKMVYKHIFAEGDVVLAHFGMSGVNSGESMGMPATGKIVSVDGYDCMRFENGKVVEYWSVVDVMKMMMQMGLMPPMGEEEVKSGK